MGGASSGTKWLYPSSCGQRVLLRSQNPGESTSTGSHGWFATGSEELFRI